jgi:hypoxanthine-DNA glycosylase
MSELTCGLPAVVRDDSVVLILGTIPSRASIRMNEYYGNPGNQFWKLIFKVFGMKPNSEYEDRIAFLQEKRIALWDVLMKCEREGSSDYSIRHPRANEFNDFLHHHRTITHIFFNGKRSEELFNKLVTLDSAIESHIVKERLPSSSSANTTKFKQKLERWRCIAYDSKAYVKR